VAAATGRGRRRSAAPQYTTSPKPLSVMTMVDRPAGRQTSGSLKKRAASSSPSSPDCRDPQRSAKESFERTKACRSTCSSSNHFMLLFLLSPLHAGSSTFKSASSGPSRQVCKASWADNLHARGQRDGARSRQAAARDGRRGQPVPDEECRGVEQEHLRLSPTLIIRNVLVWCDGGTAMHTQSTDTRWSTATPVHRRDGMSRPGAWASCRTGAGARGPGRARTGSSATAPTGERAVAMLDASEAPTQAQVSASDAAASSGCARRTAPGASRLQARPAPACGVRAGL